MTPPNSSGQNVVKGFFLLLACHAGAIVLFLLLGWLGGLLGIWWMSTAMAFAAFGIGLSQLFYAVPLGIWLYRQRKLETLKGVAIAALITFLLCGGCFAWFWTSFSM